jgi:hypothetical protein
MRHTRNPIGAMDVRAIRSKIYRRNGLKNEVFAVSLLFVARQFNDSFLGKLPKIRDLAPRAPGRAKSPPFLHKSLHNDLTERALRLRADLPSGELS